MLAQRTLKMPFETDKIYLDKVLNPLPIMLQNSQTHFKNPAAFAGFNHSTTL